MSSLTVVDTTLRDGAHAGGLPARVLTQVTGLLEASGVPVIEVGHGYGLGGAALPGGSLLDEEAQLEAASRSRRHSRLAVLAVDGVATPDHVRRAVAHGAEIVRVAAVADADRPASGLVEAARAAGATVVGFLMLAHTATPARLAARAAELADCGVDVIQLADSAGTLLPAQVTARLAAVAERVVVPFGVHAHANLGLAVANTLAAADMGATWLDGTLAGVGAGAGNAPVEVLAAALEHQGLGTGLDVSALLSAAEQIAATWPGPLPRADAASVTMALHGLYGTLLQPARDIAARHGLPVVSLIAAARGARTPADLEEAALVMLARDRKEQTS